MSPRLAAVDLGATSGRVMLGEVGPDSVVLREAHRFANGPVRLGATLHWDVLGSYRETLAGLRAAGALGGGIDGIGIDSWAVDYGLLDRDGALLGNPVCYRDSRTDGIAESVHERVPAADLWRVTGLRALPFNTIYQLLSEVDGPRLAAAETMLLIPDLLGYWLTGEVGAERTNASTTGLYDARRREWADLAARVGIPPRLLAPLRSAGDLVGRTAPAVTAELGAGAGVPVVAVGSHDTASAVIGVPAAAGSDFAYISSGTWSLVGMELAEPVLTERARRAGFSNEAGIDGTTRLLRNVTGLWVLSETLRTWDRPVPLADALAAAAVASAFGPLIDIDAPELLAPGDMAARIADACHATGQRPPVGIGATARCVLESLAMAYRRTLRRLTEVTGRPVEVVHLVGGGTHNELLCALTADACGVPVVAGPVEAAALGNVLVQARTLGVDLPDRWAMRALLRRRVPTRTYLPAAGSPAWDTAESRATALGLWDRA